MAKQRADHKGTARTEFERAKKRILKTQSVCGICGMPVDKKIKYPDPMSACIDHIIPLAKGGHPFDPDNLQLAHSMCNRQKSDKLVTVLFPEEATAINNNDLPQSADWRTF